mmetsp:Transcript_62547/g.104086  ORF Transcript_62547/g.104086 Transcript_62547/m.104086 type:complete len:84 (+) Transcript_62547:315-566(+)
MYCGKTAGDSGECKSCSRCMRNRKKQGKGHPKIMPKMTNDTIGSLPFDRPVRRSLLSSEKSQIDYLKRLRRQFAQRTPSAGSH